MSRLHVKLREVLLLRLRTLTCDLSFANVNFTYVHTHGKITRQWKSTQTLITIVNALTSIQGNILCKHQKVFDVVLDDGI